MTVLELAKELEVLRECKKETIWLLKQIDQYKVMFPTGMSRKTHMAYYPHQVTENKERAFLLEDRIKRATTKALRENLKWITDKINRYKSILEETTCDT